ncbi:MAG: polyphenol oxidase family protein, partial [Acidimicrobiales bacterium]
APVALASPEGIIGLAHAGRRGRVAGVVDATASAMRALGASSIDAALGPCIHAECYEFSEADLAVVAERLGPTVRAATADGRPALDVPAAVASACDLGGVRLVETSDRCTACDGDGYFSHRARAEPERQALVMWLP